MALLKTKILDIGVDASYWKITSVNVNKMGMTVYFELSLYVNQTISQNGGSKTGVSYGFSTNITKEQIASDIVAFGYDFIKTQISSIDDLNDAVDA